MHFVQADSNGPQVSPDHQLATKQPQGSSTLPFGRSVSLASISGPTYLTAQALVQQAAYTLSDKIFTYSPDSFDLDLALAEWQRQGEHNAFGFAPVVRQMQTRSGAGSIALGYIFSPDFDLKKRHLPQTIVASSASLKYLRASLDQLSLLYNVANPVVIHTSAVDYSTIGTPSLVTDYVAPQTIAEDLGLSLISSTSIYEVQHMALLATLMAKDAPAIHVYDGVDVGRETTRVVDVMSQKGVSDAYRVVSHQVASTQTKRMDAAAKASNLLTAFNDELGTDYKFFEYYGHSEPESVLVVFGSVEGSLAAQLAFALGNTGAKVGAINVRVYRPFLEDAFVETLPKTVKHIAVLGQVENHVAVKDESIHSNLYADVLAAITFSAKFQQQPVVSDVKYGRSEVWTPSKILAEMQSIRKDAPSAQHNASEERPNLDVLGPTVKQYSFWDLDGSVTARSPTVLAELLSREASENVSLRTRHNNLVRGGVVRTDIRSSPKSIEAPYSVTAATLAIVNDEVLLKDYDILRNIHDGGAIVVKMPGAKSQDAEKRDKRLSIEFRNHLAKKQIRLFILDTAAAAKVVEQPELEGLLMQLVFLRFSQNTLEAGAAKLSIAVENKEIVSELAKDVEGALFEFDTSATWTTQEDAAETKALPADLRTDSFMPFDRDEEQQPTFLKSWITAAKGMAFKEATGNGLSLRPDLPTKTYTVTVKERRRLTPLTYDRNIFHIEFDLGESGLTYAIGEALGIHAENDRAEVEQFIKWYGLDADAVVEVPSRANPDTELENRTVYQSLMQNIDIFGRPPKRFYQGLAEYASDEAERKQLLALGGGNREGDDEFKRRAEVDTVTYADVLLDFPSAHPAFHDIVKLVAPMKRREYSVASSQKVTPRGISLLIVTVNWVDPKGRDRFGQATRYLNDLAVGQPVTVSVKPSVMKLPKETTAPLVMAGLGTGLAPFRAFVQERAYQRQVLGLPIGDVLLYMGSRHQREEYLYGEEWEAYRDAGVITLMGCAFSRDQPQKIYIQDRMRESMHDIRAAYLEKGGSFYLCGPTWPVPDVQGVLEETIEFDGKQKGVKKVNARREIEQLKDDGRYVLEVY